MTAAYQVNTTMDDGTSYRMIVLARTAADAGVLVGTMIRAARGIDLDSENVAGIGQQSSRRLSDDYVKLAVNQMFRTDLFAADPIPESDPIARDQVAYHKAIEDARRKGPSGPDDRLHLDGS